MRDMLCIDSETKIILYQGKLHNGRGIRFILTCLKHLDDVALVVVGDQTREQDIPSRHAITNGHVSMRKTQALLC